MNNQLSIRAATDWCTVAWAAEQIGVSGRQVYRWVQDGTLVGQTARHGTRESGRRHLILDVDDVLGFARAYKRARAYKMVNAEADAS